ncbi:hypothetical protein B0H16DRAFT_1744534 [Mycena metata]|uniref:Uncharacterized protein n=1 Tax=Mycena metata TaxID=1033252 RepID=A0AAD7H500_9AGAR|nr:hypothetical protein B0H16DRAFT_1744534 [Mycena metata]
MFVAEWSRARDEYTDSHNVSSDLGSGLADAEDPFLLVVSKETRNTAGLRVSGVGGVVCARHECVRPNGLGDLQKGERYANMDFIAMSAAKDFNLMELTVSYDIAYFEVFLLHLSFLPGVGKSDGEGIERLWAELNAFAYHTKNMGLGHRADTIEDKISYHNLMKNLGQDDRANILQRKLLVAIAERARQVESFKEVKKSIPTDVRAAWQERVDAFHADLTQRNPYLINSKDGPSEADVRTLLKADEKEAATKGNAPLHGTSATAFLTAGLQLEDFQRRIKAELAGSAIITADRESKLQEHRLAFLAKLRVFRALQQIYTPAAIRAVENVERGRVPDMPPVKAEHIRLFLPSSLTATQRAKGCQEGFPEMEAQCTDALTKLRSRLHAKRHVLYWRAGNTGGQHDATRSNTLIAAAHTALRALKGPHYRPNLKPLKESDLTLDGDVKDTESAAKKKLSLIAAGKGGRVPCHIEGTSRTVMSWIWAARGALDDGEADLHESLQVEWAHAKARKNRWEEEVNLIREEMRRVLRYLEWETGVWEERAGMEREDLSPEVRAGLKAYALKRADMHRSLGAIWFTQLSVPLGDAAAAVAFDDGDLPSLFTEGTRIDISLVA